MNRETQKETGEFMAKKKHGKSGSTPAIIQLEKAGVAFRTLEYEHSSDDMGEGYGIEAARKLGLDPTHVFKTLLAGDGREIVVGVVPVSGHLDLKKLAAAAGLKKVTMVDPHEAEKATGYVVGGISPLGQKTRHRMFLDLSAMDSSEILVSGGKRGFDIALSPTDLLEVTKGQAVDIAKW